MASARGRKSRTKQRSRSWNGRRQQHGRRQESRSRRSLVKKRKLQVQAKRQPVKKQRKRASKCSFHSTNTKTLNRTKGDGRFLSHQAKGLMVCFLMDIYKEVSSKAERLRRVSRHRLIGPVHVRAALQRLVPKKRWRRLLPVGSRNKH